LTGSPTAGNSACTRGAPYAPPDSACIVLIRSTSRSSASCRAARAGAADRQRQNPDRDTRRTWHSRFTPTARWVILDEAEATHLLVSFAKGAWPATLSNNRDTLRTARAHPRPSLVS
jgi:hypothetical protein